jgi:hypothetical protein
VVLATVVIVVIVGDGKVNGGDSGDSGGTSSRLLW